MNMYEKKEAFAQKLREQQRRQIIARRREGSEQVQVGEKIHFSSQIMTFTIEQLVNWQKLPDVLELLPKVVAQIIAKNKTIINFEQFELQNQQIMIKIFSLSLTLLPILQANSPNEPMIRKMMVACTAILAQITTLSTQSLFNLFFRATAASEQKLTKQQSFISICINHLLPPLLQWMENNCNLQVNVNCIYVCGNLYQGLAGCDVDLREMEIKLFGSLKAFCFQFPLYENSMCLFLWFLRNCCITRLDKGKKQQQHSNEIQFFNNSILRTLSEIIELTLKTINPSLSQTSSYLQQIICDCLTLTTFLTVAIPELSHSLIITMLMMVWEGMPGLRDKQVIYEHIIEVLVERRGLRGELIGLIDEMCARIFRLEIHCGKSGQLILCEIMDRRETKKCHKALFLGCFNSCKIVFSSKYIIADRDYRISMVRVWDELLDTLSESQVCELIDSDQQSPMILLQENPKLSKKRRKQAFHKFMKNECLPYLLNILELVLIDMEEGNWILAIKLIGKMIENWQLPQELVRDIVLDLELDQSLLRCQQCTTECVYNSATETLDILGIDS